MTKRRAQRRPSAIRRPLRGYGGTSTYPFTITGFNPTALLVGSPNTPVHVLGIGFPIDAKVYVNGVLRATTYETTGSLLITITAAEAAAQALYSIQVKTATKASNSVFFAVAIAVPTLATRTPAFGYRGEGNMPVAVTGTGIYPSTTGTANGAPIGFAFGSTTTGTFTVPSATAIGDYTLALLNQPPGGGPSNGLLFQVRLRPPVVSSLSSTSHIAGRPNAPITITGPASPAAFYADSVVEVDGVVVPSTTLTGSTIRFTFPDEIVASPGFKSVRVRNPSAGAGGGLSGALSFEFIPFPTLLAIDITEVVQYFDGFRVRAAFDRIDPSFVVTYNDVAQPTIFVDPQLMNVDVTSAACAVPGTTMVRARDPVSGLSTNAIAITVFPWNPLRLGATLRLWLDGSSLVDDGTGKASSWQDKSGGGRHFVPVTAGQLPAIVTSALLNSQPAARFASSPLTNLTYTPWLVNPANTAQGLINADRYTIWAVAVTTSLGFGQALMGDYFGYIKFGLTINAPVALEGLDSSSAATYVRTPITWYPTPNPFVLRQRKGGGFFGGRIKRDAEVVATLLGNTATFNPSIAYLGSGSATGNAWVGDVGEVIVCDSDVNSTHKAIMDNRFSYLYELPFGSGVGKPQITSIAPATCHQYDLPFWLYANDSAGGYTTSSVINAFDTPLVTEFISATQIRTRMLASLLEVAKGLAITVADSGGISAPAGLAILPYVDVPGIPNLHTTVPSTAIQHGDPLPIRVRGVGFTAASVVKVNGTSLATTLDTVEGELLATLPATALDVLPGPIITVSDPSGDSPNSLEITLTPWTPKSLPGLQGWWGADDVVTAAGKVTQFNDKSGRGRHAVQADVAKQGIYTASDPAFNGKPSVQLDGVDDVYVISAAILPPPTSVMAAVYRYLVVDGAGGPTQPYVNDAMFAATNIGVTAHLSPLTLIGYVSDGTYRSVSNAALVVGQTQRCQFRITANVMTLEVGSTVSAPYTLATYTTGAVMNVGFMNFGTNNAMNGKLATWLATSVVWSDQDSICWKNWCRYNYGTAA